MKRTQKYTANHLQAHMDHGMRLRSEAFHGMLRDISRVFAGKVR